jgi:hypothetical protein
METRHICHIFLMEINNMLLLLLLLLRKGFKNYVKSINGQIVPY